MAETIRFRIVPNKLQDPSWKQTYRVEEFREGGLELHRSPFDSIEEARKVEKEILEFEHIEFREVD